MGCFISTKTFTPVPQRSHFKEGKGEGKSRAYYSQTCSNTDTRSRATQAPKFIVTFPTTPKLGVGRRGLVSNVFLQLFRENMTNF